MDTALIYLHPASDGRKPRGQFEVPIGLSPAPLQFRVLALWRDVDAREALRQGRPGLLPFVGLMKHGALPEVAHAARTLQNLALSTAVRADLMAALYLLGGHRFSGAALRGIMDKEVLMESATYRETIEEGVRMNVLRQLRRRLGDSVPEGLEDRIQSTSFQQVEAVSDLLVDVAISNDELLKRIEAQLASD